MQVSTSTAVALAAILATFTLSGDTLYVETVGAPSPTRMVQAAFLDAGIASVEPIGPAATWGIFENPSGPLGTYLWQATAPALGVGFVGRQALARIDGAACGTLAGTAEVRFLEWACGSGWCATEIEDRGRSVGCATVGLGGAGLGSWSAVKGLFR